MDVSIEPYGWASDLHPEDLTAATAVFNAGWHDWNERERPLSVEAYVAYDRFSAPPEVILRRLARADDGTVVGLGQACWRDGEPGACLGRVFVAPEARRRGVATALTRVLIDDVRAAGRTGLTLETVEGDHLAPVMARHGFRPDMVIEQNWADAATASDELLARWVATGEAAEGYSLVRYDAPAPDALADAFVAVRHVMNDAPRREGEPPFEFSVEELRAVEATAVAAHQDWWAVAVRHDDSGELVGLSEMFLPRLQPTMALQGDTGVVPAHRGHGLGAWMKAVNHQRLRAERREVEVVQTWNASSNAPMLRINRELGFAPVQRYRSWFLPLD